MPVYLLIALYIFRLRRQRDEDGGMPIDEEDNF
jgi:hypothetical protein